MNLTINVDELGFTPTPQMEREQIDGKTTRPFRGNDSNLLPVPGCLEVTAVRMPGLMLESERIDEVPLDGTERPRMLAIRRKIYRLIQGLDGTPMLQRASCSNEGRWQKPRDGEYNIFVTGRWDETVSPALPHGLTIPEARQPRVGVEIGGPAPDTAQRRQGRHAQE